MNKYFPFILFVLSLSLFSQNKNNDNIQHIYLQEIIKNSNESSFVTFDTDDIEWRKKAVKKITSKSNIQESSFLKTAMLLHMLKYKLGDSVLFKAIEEYKSDINTNNKEVSLLDFQQYLEDISDISLTKFFNDWFKSKGHPSYEIGWYQNTDTKEMSFSVKQKQSDASVSFFEMPLPIKLIGTEGESQIVRLELSENGQTFNGRVPFVIKDILIDPDYQLISRNNIVKQGLDQEVLNKDISLYPNPAVNIIKVHNLSHAKVERISIYDMLGKLVIDKTGPISKINLKQLSKGLHLVKIETSQGTLHKTILKN